MPWFIVPEDEVVRLETVTTTKQIPQQPVTSEISVDVQQKPDEQPEFEVTAETIPNMVTFWNLYLGNR